MSFAKITVLNCRDSNDADGGCNWGRGWVAEEAMYVLVHCKPGRLNMATSTLVIQNITLKRQISDPDIITCTYKWNRFRQIRFKVCTYKGRTKGQVIHNPEKEMFNYKKRKLFG